MFFSRNATHEIKEKVKNFNNKNYLIKLERKKKAKTVLDPIPPFTRANAG